MTVISRIRKWCVSDVVRKSSKVTSSLLLVFVMEIWANDNNNHVEIYVTDRSTLSDSDLNRHQSATTGPAETDLFKKTKFHFLSFRLYLPMK